MIKNIFFFILFFALLPTFSFADKEERDQKILYQCKITLEPIFPSEISDDKKEEFLKDLIKEAQSEEIKTMVYLSIYPMLADLIARKSDSRYNETADKKKFFEENFTFATNEKGDLITITFSCATKGGAIFLTRQIAGSYIQYLSKIPAEEKKFLIEILTKKMITIIPDSIQRKNDISKLLSMGKTEEANRLKKENEDNFKNALSESEGFKLKSIMSKLRKYPRTLSPKDEPTNVIEIPL